jgi:hypothetical protein
VASDRGVHNAELVLAYQGRAREFRSAQIGPPRLRKKSAVIDASGADSLDVAMWTWRNLLRWELMCGER